jgi:hypothetical protein
MWEVMARAAAEEATRNSGAGSDLLRQLGNVDVVYSLSWQYDDPAGGVAARLGATPARKGYLGIGGTIPVTLAFGRTALPCRAGRGRTESAVPNENLSLAIEGPTSRRSPLDGTAHFKSPSKHHLGMERRGNPIRLNRVQPGAHVGVLPLGIDSEYMRRLT